MARVSVCITHYNRPDKLAATLESLARQTRQPDEVFLWDDHSPRDPTEVALSFKNRFRHFVYHRNEQNLRMPGNLNAVVAQATGDFVANLHDADEFHPRLLEKWEAALVKNSTAGLVFCGLDAATKSQGAAPVWIHDFVECSPGRSFFKNVYVASSSSPIWGTVMVRREAYARHLPFDSRFRAWADVDMWMRICGTHDIAYVAEPLIILDHSPTPARAFSWEKFLITHRMPTVNIHRIAANDVERKEWLARQQRWTRRWYLKHLSGRLVRGEIRPFFEGLALWRESLIHLPKTGCDLAPGVGKLCRQGDGVSGRVTKY